MILNIINIKEMAHKIGLIDDYIVEQGTKDGWEYRKWNSGFIELWKMSYHSNVNCNTSSNSVYVGNYNAQLPFSISIGRIFCSINNASKKMFVLDVWGSSGINANVSLGSMASTTNATCYLNWYVTGKWK